MNRAVIGVGSNIDPHQNIEQAKKILAQHHDLLAESTFVETEPIGFLDQANFINGAFLIQTDLDQEALSAWLKKVENDLGRVRTENKYGPRTIDLDIVVWNGQVIDKHVYERSFLRAAILEVYPEITI